jgi:hypothetical protein
VVYLVIYVFRGPIDFVVLRYQQKPL